MVGVTRVWRQPALLNGAPELELVDVDRRGVGRLTVRPSLLEAGDASTLAGDDAQRRARGDASLEDLSDPSPDVVPDGSGAPGGDASAPADSDARRCAWCHSALVDVRLDLAATRFCSKRCRQAGWRFERQVSRLQAADARKRLAYADPPYPGLARRYYAGHADYGGEVDHAALLTRLATFDGWALSTSAAALPRVLDLAVDAGLDVKVAAWVRGERRVRAAAPLQSWEPVVYVPARHVPHLEQPADSLVHAAKPRLSDPGRVIGAKPAAFCSWLFGLLGARAGDELDDLFPGSGGVSRAWRTACRCP